MAWRRKAPAGRVRAISAAVTAVSTDAMDIANRIEDWQLAAYTYYGCLPEIHHPLSRIARALTQIDWRMQVNGVEQSEAVARAALDEATRGIGEDEATRRAALNLQIAGDGWYVEDEDGDFEFYAVTQKGIKEIVESTRSAGRIALRVYNPDPQNTDKADSAMRAVIGPAEELVLLEALSRSQARSRMGQAGVWFLPADVEGNEEFFTDLEQAQAAAIHDEHAPDAVTPLFIEYPAELIPVAVGGHITFDRPYDDAIPEKVDLATRRIAIGLDIPVELLLGLGDVNHWTAWLVDEDTWKSHEAPLADQIGELYARVTEIKRGLTEGSVRYLPDPAKLLAHKSSIRDAIDLAKLGAVGQRYLRDLAGATDEDAPTPEEIALLAALTGGAREPGVDESPGAPEAPAAIAASTSRVDHPLIAGAALMARDQARARIGAKLRSKLGRSPLSKTIDGVDNADVVATVGLDVARRHLDLDREIVDSLSSFSAWWTKHDPAPLPAAAATLLLGTHLAETLAIPYEACEPVPPKLVTDLASGLRAIGAAASRPVDLDRLARDLNRLDRDVLERGVEKVTAAGVEAIAAIYEASDLPEHPRPGFMELRDAGVDVHGICETALAPVVEWWDDTVRATYDRLSEMGVAPAVDVDGAIGQSVSVLSFGFGLWVAANLDREPSDQLMPPTALVRKAMAKAGGA